MSKHVEEQIIWSKGKTREELAKHSIETVGTKLRAMMPWIGKKKLVDSDKK